LQDDVEQVGVDRLVVGGWWLRPGIAIADRTAGSRRRTLGIVDLNPSTLPIHFEHDEPKRDADRNDQHPEQPEASTQRTDTHLKDALTQARHDPPFQPNALTTLSVSMDAPSHAASFISAVIVSHATAIR